jgi:hypothetical protein
MMLSLTSPEDRKTAARFQFLRSRFISGRLLLLVRCAFHRRTRAVNQNVHNPAGAMLPTGERRGVENTDKHTKEVVWVGVVAEIAARYGGFD